MNKLIKYIWTGCMLTACSTDIKPIDYGKDPCAYCMMTIMDQRFGCEIGTRKGKMYKFDAVECMVHFLDNPQFKDISIKEIVTNTYDKPASLISVYDVSFLQSPNMPSPMGQFINPFSQPDSAAAYKVKNGGRIYTWDTLRKILAQ